MPHHSSVNMEKEPSRSSFEEDGEIYIPRKQNNRSRTILAGFFVILIIFTFGGWYILKNNAKRDLGDCGTNATEALANGCVFDHISYAWMKPECYYKDLVDEYSNHSEVRYYSAPSLDENSLLPMEQVINGDYATTFTPRDFHSVHCALSVARVHWALMHHLPIDSYAISFEHTKHCQEVLLGTMDMCRGPNKCKLSKTTARFSSCSYLS